MLERSLRGIDEAPSTLVILNSLRDLSIERYLLVNLEDFHIALRFVGSVALNGFGNRSIESYIFAVVVKIYVISAVHEF
jgi:hypothetical protein